MKKSTALSACSHSGQFRLGEPLIKPLLAESFAEGLWICWIGLEHAENALFWCTSDCNCYMANTQQRQKQTLAANPAPDHSTNPATANRSGGSVQ